MPKRKFKHDQNYWDKIIGDQKAEIKAPNLKEESSEIQIQTKFFGQKVDINPTKITRK